MQAEGGWKGANSSRPFVGQNLPHFERM